tara:strand:- start:825 stop:1505 length:681 start_codon:yes stop_codon:yes gene_type:complete
MSKNIVDPEVFKKNKYCIIRGALDPKIAEFIYNYFLLKRQTAKTLFRARWIPPFDDNHSWGTFYDPMIPNPKTYSLYGDVAFETILLKVLPLIKEYSGMNVQPTYSYARLYQKGDVLYRHFDRFSCEVSASMHIGNDGIEWPIRIDNSGKTNQVGVAVNLKPGDMFVYSGCECEHWREALTGNDYCQVFLHTNNSETEGAQENIYDGRYHLGLPKGFKASLGYDNN